MNELILFGMLILNFGISWWNAWSAGRFWTEAKVVGGWVRVIVWAAVVMAAVGFTWVYLTLLTVGAVIGELLTYEQASVMFDLGYLILIPALLGSGTVIWIHSLIVAWKRRNLGDVAVAAWNTYAHARNVWTAASHSGDALENVMKFFFGGKRKSSKDSAAALLIILLVILALTGGIITTALIVRHADKNYAMDVTSTFEE
ncbi:hypothetical protein A3J20_01850 [Candidatus Gottesmanbacteria bacterium RIFCSPLOWO2_02_FULL_42_29]|uniref:Uncharacterized protein n=1 Tax=Candidatus Gottesmanbacteria bacterium RIFCSPLOWO2_01_FULL_42_22 TaxID=1798391 RepID=A0A1F6BEQ8_9BACT|nr:MAG: hypothetical protein UV46_C0034G0007 [Candidatus Gottesmanbacteria bacterium GW2011_GWC2_42_8]OGG12182.1 MAG: hypothetical protein A2781_04655 [Candidatus Gottesmanbacteria bacterium RIFCSPHIGHO2_01_FULL_42_27]OGG19924.1 MAG: hypothetical protein A3E72_02815 [Candidatus Gottesmanbacteria bacterium RIFCSPHIGHO2_12_FULL_43_26]OGG33372.1 MAG: hypothetical protein A3G68_03285 [Candidatus Gottesmanbacteria bacterium RIFCSPLOWO2_12_FULL_42_10]OGG35007.1 MAG: hypothetical protein A2968_00020 [